MTTSIAFELERTREEQIPDRLPTFNSELASLLAAQLEQATHVRFPSDKWRADPVGFFRDVLGVDPWSKQIEIIEAIRDNRRVAVKSGHKVSKSNTAAGIALWFYCSFEDARAIFTSTTSRQVDDILWREVRMLVARSGLCLACKKENLTRSLGTQISRPCPHSAIIDGELGELARTGLKSRDFREVKGFTAKEAEAVAGISGKNLLYLIDEASGIKPEIFEAIEGNRAGGAWVVMFGNPTQTVGEFYDAFNSKERFYSTHTVSSEETPNVVYGDDDPRAIEGLATSEWIKEKKEEWGEDSALYKVRVRGEFAEIEEGRIFSIHAIAEAESRWNETPAVGRLWIGFDPAGDGPTGDESIWVPRRGQKILDIVAKVGQSKESLIVHTLGVCKQHKTDREVPVVVLDREGKLGSEVYGAFLSFLSGYGDEAPFELVAVRASDRAHRNPAVYDRMRDELSAVLSDWIASGGAIVTDTKLAKEMHAFEWTEQINGRVKVTPKKDVRRDLGRSPDRYDALALSVWEPAALKDGAAPKRKDTTPDRPATAIALDPYAGAAHWDVPVPE